MRYLGVDYGEKRIGLALSDEKGNLAFPAGIIENKGKAPEEVLAFCATNQVEAIVVGESTDFKGNDNPVMEKIKKFLFVLKEKSGLLVYLEPEFLTSAQALRTQGEHKKIDTSAAALILQTFLDKKKYDHDR